MIGHGFVSHSVVIFRGMFVCSSLQASQRIKFTLKIDHKPNLLQSKRGHVPRENWHVKQVKISTAPDKPLWPGLTLWLERAQKRIANIVNEAQWVLTRTVRSKPRSQVVALRHTIHHYKCGCWNELSLKQVTPKIGQQIAQRLKQIMVVDRSWVRFLLRHHFQRDVCMQFFATFTAH